MNTTHPASTKMALAMLAATAAIVLTVASCGGDDDGASEPDVVRPSAVAPATVPAGPPPRIISDDANTRAAVATVKSYYRAMRDQDPVAACAQLTAAKRRADSYPGQTCQSTYRDLIAQDRKKPGYPKRWTAEIVYASTVPPNGAIKVKVGGESPVGVAVKKQRGRWKLDAPQQPDLP